MPGDALAAALAAAATVAAYLAARALQARLRWTVLHPVLVATAALVAVLLSLGVPYARYEPGGRLLSWWLGPAVVALGVPLHRQAGEVLRGGRRLLVAVVSGSVAGIVAAAGTAALLGAPRAVVLSLVPRSVTTPIAVAVAEEIGGVPGLSAAVSIASGIAGAVAGPALLRSLGVRGRGAWGLGMGAAAHGVGTARAAEEGPVEAAAAGLAIGLVGVATALLAPLAAAVLRLVMGWG